VIAFLLRAGKVKMSAAIGVLVAITALADWSIGNTASLGLFYILPMMLGGTVLAPIETAGLAILCSALRTCFDVPSTALESSLRFVFATLTYGCSGLFVTALIRNRELEEQLKVLVESSPAAILTTDSAGTVLASNRAADALLLIPPGRTLRSARIADYLPLLADALKLNTGPEGFRTAAQCQGRRDNGEIFLAHTWFSSYKTPRGLRLAAIVVDASEEMRDREEEGLRQLIRGNRIAAAAVSHEVRNLCSAIALLSSNLKEKHSLERDEDFQGLHQLVEGLRRIASYELHGAVSDSLDEVSLRQILDDLRIVIEADWSEIDGAVRWHLPPAMPAVLGERQGLFQAFLNLAQNSRRAVESCAVRELSVAVSVDDRAVHVRFRDTGPGISEPDRLFQPFQEGADGAGLGLYVSRAVVRSYGGDLCWEPHTGGTCFRVDVPVAGSAP